MEVRPGARGSRAWLHGGAWTGTWGRDFIQYPLVGKEVGGGFEDGSVKVHIKKISMATKLEGTGLESFRAFPYGLHSPLQHTANPCPTSVGGSLPIPQMGTQRPS